MIYKYMFRSPIKYWVTTDNKYYEDREYALNDIDNNQDEIFKNLSKVLMDNTINFVEYMNNPGIIDISFSSYDGNVLDTIVKMDHLLTYEEFKKLYTDIQYQLMDGIGKKIENICLKEFESTIEYNENNITVYKPAIKYVFCMLFQYDGWNLQFIRDNR